MGKYAIVIFLMFASTSAIAQYTIAGKVIDGKTQVAVEFATLFIPANELWAVTDENGAFVIQQVPQGKIEIVIQRLGFARQTYELTITTNITDLLLKLDERDLTLEEVVVTARKNTGLTTSFTMDRTAFDHMQMLNVTDAASLLPGGKTNRTLHLATGMGTGANDGSQEFSVNGARVNGSVVEMGNAVFGVAVEIDGVRLSGNAIPGTVSSTQTRLLGSDTRNISTANVESIEIITGIPSVEHSDMTNGMVRINTRKGKSPFILDLATKPNTKQISLGKGFALGHKLGVVNLNLEHTRSISNLVSPYTAYARNGLSLNYSNIFNENNNQPIAVEFGVHGNLGGYNSESDPDFFVKTYSKMNDNAIRANASVRWLLNKKWITNVEASGALNYNNRQEEVSTNRSSSSSVAAIHATQTGYYVGQTYDENPNTEVKLIPPGYWYQVWRNDSRLVNQSARLKANWARRFGTVNHNLLIGGEYTGNRNNGRGDYYTDMRYAPTWREYRYDRVSTNNNYGIYAEEMIQLPVGRGEFQVVAGVRGEVTAISGSEYGNVGNWSPRMNAQYIFWEKSTKTVENLSVKFGWGKTVKLPSFSVLYPETGYRDIRTFEPGTTAEGSTYYAFYSTPVIRQYNPELKWQSNIQHEVSVNATIAGVDVSLIAAQDKTYHAYEATNTYSPFTYKFTSQSSLEGSVIPIDNRIYQVDRQTGVVTVTDKTGTYPTETLAYREVTRPITILSSTNGSPVLRRRLSWIIQFKQIAALKTRFRVDGHYYYYKGIEQLLKADRPVDNVTMTDGTPYKYIAFYTGGSGSSNGNVSHSVNINVTAITHIPALRLIVSFRVEGTLYNQQQRLSEYSDGGQRGFVLNSRDEYVPIEGNISDGNQFVGLYPEYYVSLNDMNTHIPFEEKFLWAKENDITLYNDLAKLVVKTPTNYFFNENKTSAYYSANFSVTKEIGRIASISFNATNFINSLSRVRSSENNARYSLFGSSMIPAFYYGLSLRLKL